MTTELTFSGFTTQLREFIRGCEIEAPSTDARFNELALALFQLQFQHNAAYRRLCDAKRMTPIQVQDWRNIPAAPASAFKEMELTSLSPEERTTIFFSSGTTAQRSSRHFHSAESLSIYEASLLPWFERHLLADVNELVDEQLLGPLDKLRLLALTPAPNLAPNSSLVHMFDTVRREFGSRDSLFAGRVDPSGAWTLDMDATLFAIRKSMCANRPLVLLGTAFNFVHLLDHFATNNMRYRLAQGSRVLETGGYKGQSREVSKTELHALIKKHLGITSEYIVTEYGMSELSSQAYDHVVSAGRAGCPQPAAELAAAARRGEDTPPPPCIFRFPPWARAQIISPENGQEVSEGETGLIRIFDLANVRSVMAIQTEDLGVRHGAGFELIGRAAQTEPRGCSLMSVNQTE
ncbi:MAG TPA: hypothetical protein VK846_10020 [Candidatus Limnocylindria bacterium]|nr:hypothetical protein [Candidatus Limnocylindria bacterium]